MPRPADLEVDPVLPLELDLLVVDPPRQDHGAVQADQVLARQAEVLRILESDAPFLLATLGGGSTPVDLDFIPASAIERVEYLRGGAAAQYGSDAIAGVINLRLREARLEADLLERTSDDAHATLKKGLADAPAGFAPSCEGHYLAGRIAEFEHKYGTALDHYEAVLRAGSAVEVSA